MGHRYVLVVHIFSWRRKLFIYAESTLLASWHQPFDNFTFKTTSLEPLIQSVRLIYLVEWIPK